MSGGDPGAPGGRSTRRVLVGLVRVASAVLASVIAAGLVGQVCRDRSVAMALLMYVPLMPIGLVAVAVDLAGLGRGLPRLRFGLGLLGCAAIGWAAVTMIGS